MKHVDESRAAATATTALARDVGDGQRIVPSQYVPTGAVVAHGVQLAGVMHSASAAGDRRGAAPSQDPQTRSEDLDCYSGGGYQPAGQAPTRWCGAAPAEPRPLCFPLNTQSQAHWQTDLSRSGLAEPGLHTRTVATIHRRGAGCESDRHR